MLFVVDVKHMCWNCFFVFCCGCFFVFPAGVVFLLKVDSLMKLRFSILAAAFTQLSSTHEPVQKYPT